MINHSKKIILASNSPRRQELLKYIGFEFDINVIESDESYDASKSPEEIALHIAQNKALPYTILENTILITADTIVALENSILGKPKSSIEAIEMLQLLSGKMHSVITGVCIKTLHETIQFTETTKVYFKEITIEDIIYYVENFNPLDKAGAYGIQEWIGMIAIDKIEGSYYNVMGLPTAKLFIELKKSLKK